MSQPITADVCDLRQSCCQGKFANSIDRMLTTALATAAKSDSAEVAVFEVRDRLDKVEAVVDDHKALVKDTRGKLKLLLWSSFSISGTLIAMLLSGYVFLFRFVTSDTGHQLLKAVLQVSTK